MSRSFLAGLIFSVGFVCGCHTSGDNRLVGSEMSREDSYYGEDYGVVGNLNKVRLKNGTKISYLKLAGDANEVFVEDRVIFGKLEIWGENNTVSIPENLVIREAVVGKGNKVIRRPVGLAEQKPRRIETEKLEQPMVTSGSGNAATHEAAPAPAGQPGRGEEEGMTVIP